MPYYSHSCRLPDCAVDAMSCVNYVSGMVKSYSNKTSTDYKPFNLNYTKLVDNNRDEIDSLLSLEMNAFRCANTMLILLLSAK